MMKKNLISLAIGSALTLSTPVAFADLPVKAHLSMTLATPQVTGCLLTTPAPPCTNPAFNLTSLVGSFFNLAGSDAPIESFDGIVLGTTQPASGSHSGAPNGTEIPGIDNPWLFASNTGMHQSTSNINKIDNTTIDFTGWNVTWNGLASIPMGGDTANFASDTGIATIVCDTAACNDGEAYTLDYAAHVPVGDPSNFGGSLYVLHLEGVITDTNLAPVATLDTLLVSIPPGTSTIIDLAGNVSDPDGDGIDFGSFVIDGTGTTRTPAPTIIDDGNGSITYTDNEGTATVAADTFTYTVLDTLGKISAIFSVEVSIVTGNIPPIANDIAVTTDKNVAKVVPVFDSTSDPDDPAGVADPTTVATSNVINGTVDNIAANGDVTFTPLLDLIRPTPASFQYTILDNSGDISNVATVTVAVNNPPVATDTTIDVDRNSTTNLIVPNFASDSDGTLVLTTIVASNGTIAGGTTSVNTTTGEITYAPPTAVYIGPDEYTYTVDDNDNATSNVGTVTVIVNNVVPIAVNDSDAININNDANVIINVLLNDQDVDGTIDVTTVAATNGSNGTTSVNALTGEVTYTPDGSLTNGQDTFTYTVNDNDNGTSNVATVTVNISSGTGVLDPAAFLVFKTGFVTSDKVEPPLGDGSWFTMELDPGNPTHISIAAFNHIQLGTTQPGSVSSPNIDQPWLFSGNLGVHQTTSDMLILTDDGAGNVVLDFSGWDVSWNSIPSIPLGDGPDKGFATMTCAVNCDYDDTFVIEYRATVPDGDPSGFGNVKYRLHVEGVISALPPTLGGGDANAPFTVSDITAVDSNGAPLGVSPGAAAVAVGNTTGVHLSATDIGNKDPLLNTSDGEQCIGGCADYVVSGVTTDYVELVFTLLAPIRDGSKLRKLINGKWSDFDTSEGGQVGSAADDGGGICQGPEALFANSLREGNRCVFIRIFDGGPNDADGVKNGTIVDPSGVLIAGSPNVPPSSKSSGALSWMSLAFVLSLLSLIRIKRT